MLVGVTIVMGGSILHEATRRRAAHGCADFEVTMRTWGAKVRVGLAVGLIAAVAVLPAIGEGDWEITPASDAALDHGVDWLVKNQGPEGNWQSNDLGLVGMGALAIMAAGHTSGIGPGKAADRALDYVVRNARPSGLLNIAKPQADMYNHGLATFVLGQAYGMTGDRRIGPVLDRALKLIAATQCTDGGWDYTARSQEHGHDLSLAVMQAKALRSATDSGFEVSPHVIAMAIRDVREHYCPANGQRNAPESVQATLPGQFTYGKGGGEASVAMAAAGVVCLQEFGQYDDWRIRKSMAAVVKAIHGLKKPPDHTGELPFDAYTLYYVGQALYQLGGDDWKENYPKLRDWLIASQAPDGSWHDTRYRGGQQGKLYGTSVACFVLAIPNRYLPILQEGHIAGLHAKFQSH